MFAHVKFQRAPPSGEGRRSRKKAQTRAAIEDAALSLFAEQRYESTTLEQIAERADISTATFFHYFRGKADVVLSEQGAKVAPLCQAILERPASESDLTAVRNALLENWVATVDPERTARTAHAVASAPVLQGMSYQIGRTWLSGISEALARRQGQSDVSEKHVLVAHVVLSVFGNAVEGWIADDCREELTTAIERSFDLLLEVSDRWARSDGHLAAVR